MIIEPQISEGMLKYCEIENKFRHSQTGSHIGLNEALCQILICALRKYQKREKNILDCVDKQSGDGELWAYAETRFGTRLQHALLEIHKTIESGTTDCSKYESRPKVNKRYWGQRDH